MIHRDVAARESEDGETRVRTDRVPVLLVDDNPGNLVALEAILDAPDLELVSVTSGHLALQCAAEQDFAVILLDSRMPRLSGLETVVRLREGERNRHTPVILLTAAEADEQDVLLAYARGAVDYLRKPYHAQVLKAKVLAFVASFRQQQRLREQELALQRQQREVERHWFLDTLESLTDGFLALDRDWRFTHVNAVAERVFGRTRAELIGKELWREFPELADTTFGQAYQKAMRERVTVQLEDYYAPFDAWYEVRAFATHAGLSLLFRDITDRKRHEQERARLLERESSARAQAEEQKALLELIIEQSASGIIVADRDGKIRIFNPAAQRQHGASKREVAAPEWAETYGLVTLTGEPLPLESTPLFRALHGEAVSKATWQVRLPEGSLRTLEGAATPLREPDGTPAGALLVTRDVTEERRIQALETRRARHAQLSGAIGAALTRGGELRTLLQSCTDAIVQHLDAALARIWTLDAAGEVLELQASSGLEARLDGAHSRVALGELTVGAIAKEGKPHITNDVPEDERGRVTATAGSVVAFAGYPLLHADRVLGVVAVLSREPVEEDALRALASVADSIALGIERSHIEAARQVSETRYRLATRATKDAIWDWNLATNAVAWNEGVESLFGYAVSDVAPVVAWWYEHVHPDDRERVVHGIHEAIDSGANHWRAEYRFLRRNGEFALVTDRGFISRDDAGKPVRMVGAMQDVTVARKTEELLRENEAQLRTLADSIPQLAWMANPDGHIFWYNQRWYDFTGTTLEQMQGWGWRSVHEPSLVERVIERWGASLRDGQPFEMEFPLRRHDGVYRWHLTRATPVRNAQGQIIRWFGTNTDIDDQRSARERQRFLAEASRELASSRDYEATLSHVARLAVPTVADWAAVDILGEGGKLQRLAVEHADPRKVELAHMLHRRYPPRSDASGVAKVLRTGESEWAREVPDALLEAGSHDAEHLAILRGLGLKSYLVVPLKVNDRVLGAITLVYAESGRSYAESDLTFLEDLASRAALAIDNSRLFSEVTELNASLEQRVSQRTRELKEANGELESFTYTVSHDLRAPLRHITGFSELLIKRSGEVLDEKSRAYVRTISEAAQHGGRLVDDLLGFSRLGRAELKKAAVSLAQLVSDVQRELTPEWEQRRVTWHISALPVVPGDANLLRIALQNLVSNALKYTRTTPEAVIDVSAREDAAEIEVCVKDNGVGFEMQYVDKLFGVFQRLHTAEQFEGTGIGLATVRRIIQRHGGRIWAEGAVGAGAAFHFTLPTAAATEVTR